VADNEFPILSFPGSGDWSCESFDPSPTSTFLSGDLLRRDKDDCGIGEFKNGDIVVFVIGLMMAVLDTDGLITPPIICAGIGILSVLVSGGWTMILDASMLAIADIDTGGRGRDLNGINKCSFGFEGSDWVGVGKGGGRSCG